MPPTLLADPCWKSGREKLSHSSPAQDSSLGTTASEGIVSHFHQFNNLLWMSELVTRFLPQHLTCKVTNLIAGLLRRAATCTTVRAHFHRNPVWFSVRYQSHGCCVITAWDFRMIWLQSLKLSVARRCTEIFLSLPHVGMHSAWITADGCPMPIELYACIMVWLYQSP